MIAMRVFQIVLATLLVAFARSTPTPSMSCGASSGAGGGSGNVFGIPSSSKSGLGTTNPLHVRGGELYQPETIEEADALVLNAANNAQLVVIDFTASWCGPCKMIAPFFKELSESIADVIFLKVDVDENPETAAKYSVSAMPTFVFIKQGEVVDRLMGANTARLRELIEEHM